MLAAEVMVALMRGEPGGHFVHRNRYHCVKTAYSIRRKDSNYGGGGDGGSGGIHYNRRRVGFSAPLRPRWSSWCWRGLDRVELICGARGGCSGGGSDGSGGGRRRCWPLVVSAAVW